MIHKLLIIVSVLIVLGWAVSAGAVIGVYSDAACTAPLFTPLERYTTFWVQYDINCTGWSGHNRFVSGGGIDWPDPSPPLPHVVQTVGTFIIGPFQNDCCGNITVTLTCGTFAEGGPAAHDMEVFEGQTCYTVSWYDESCLNWYAQSPEERPVEISSGCVGDAIYVRFPTNVPADYTIAGAGVADFGTVGACGNECIGPFYPITTGTLAIGFTPASGGAQLAYAELTIEMCATPTPAETPTPSLTPTQTPTPMNVIWLQASQGGVGAIYDVHYPTPAVNKLYGNASDAGIALGMDRSNSHLYWLHQESTHDMLRSGLSGEIPTTIGAWSHANLTNVPCMAHGPDGKLYGVGHDGSQNWTYGTFNKATAAFTSIDGQWFNLDYAVSGNPSNINGGDIVFDPDGLVLYRFGNRSGRFAVHRFTDYKTSGEVTEVYYHDASVTVQGACYLPDGKYMLLVNGQYLYTFDWPDDWSAVASLPLTLYMNMGPVTTPKPHSGDLGSDIPPTATPTPTSTATCTPEPTSTVWPCEDQTFTDDFEGTCGNWTYSGEAGGYVGCPEPDPLDSGNNTMRFAVGEDEWGWATRYFTVVPGHTYNLSLDVYWSGHMTNIVNVELADTVGCNVCEAVALSTLPSETLWGRLGPQGIWTTIPDIDSIVAGGSLICIRIAVGYADKPVANVYIDDIQIEDVDEPTCTPTPTATPDAPTPTPTPEPDEFYITAFSKLDQIMYLSFSHQLIPTGIYGTVFGGLLVEEAVQGERFPLVYTSPTERILNAQASARLRVGGIHPEGLEKGFDAARNGSVIYLGLTGTLTGLYGAPTVRATVYVDGVLLCFTPPKQFFSDMEIPSPFTLSFEAARGTYPFMEGRALSVRFENVSPYGTTRSVAVDDLIAFLWIVYDQ